MAGLSRGMLDYDFKAFSTSEPVILWQTWLKWLNDDQVRIHKCSRDARFLNQQNLSSLYHQSDVSMAVGQGLLFVSWPSMHPFLKTTHEMKIKYFGVAFKTHLSVAPTSFCWVILMLPLPTPVLILPTWHSRLCLFLLPSCSPPTVIQDLLDYLPDDRLPPHPRGLSTLLAAGSALPSHSLCFQFLASSPTSAAFTLPCLACHEMAHFANTLLLSGPSSCGMYLLCFPRWCLCLPHGPLLSLLFQQVSQGLLFQEDGPTASALSKLVFLSTYSL